MEVNSSDATRVAVIGAGVSGLVVARTLHEAGYGEVGVDVFDRGRHAGGRLAVRPVSRDDEVTITFDQGAPEFHARQDTFRHVVDAWIRAEICAVWNASHATWDGRELHANAPDAEARYVGVPDMAALVAQLGAGVQSQQSATVTSSQRQGAQWMLTVDRRNDLITTEGPYDAVVIAAPPPQALRLVASHDEALGSMLQSMTMEPNWVVMMLIDHPMDNVHDIIRIDDSNASLGKIVRNDAKPGRVRIAGLSAWVAHAHHAWSRAHDGSSRDDVASMLSDEVRRLFETMYGQPIPAEHVRFTRAHRWRFSRPAAPVSQSFVEDASSTVFVCGDAFGGSGVEAAYLSGLATARRVLANLRSSS